jgi:hypothetical protein
MEIKRQQPRDKIFRAKLMPRFSGRQNLHSAHTIPMHRERFEMWILLTELSEIFMAFLFCDCSIAITRLFPWR